VLWKFKKAKNSKELNTAVKDLITAPNEQIKTLAKNRVVELIYPRIFMSS